jgi:PhnB protein
MENINVPQGYQQVMPYLILKNASEFAGFCIDVFDATEKMKHLREDGEIMHAEIQIGESTIMFGGASEQWNIQTAGLFVYVADADATYQKALNKGATAITELSDQPYGRSGGVKDPFGNTWWITGEGEG